MPIHSLRPDCYRSSYRRLSFESLAARRVLAVTANFFTSIVADPTSDTIATVRVHVDSDTKLDAWIDFNGDGSLDHPSEHLNAGTSIDVSAGTNLLTINVPAGSAASEFPGSTQARFLISADGGLSPADVTLSSDSLFASITILDSANQPEIDLNITGNRINLSGQLNAVDQPELVVSNRNTVLFRAPASAVGRYNITADEFSNVLQLDFTSGNPIPSGGFDFDGGERVNTVRIIGSDAGLDLSADGNIDLKSIDVIDISDAAIQTITIDAPEASAMDPDGGGIVIVGGSEDTVQFADRELWRMREPAVVAGLAFNVVASNDTFVQIDFGSGWQNIASPSDINNDGDVTAGDALIIINELQRRAYSDGETSILNDASGVDPWPSLYYDQNNDGMATALDALRVINQIARSQNSAPSEPEFVVITDTYFAQSSKDDSVERIWQDERPLIF
jgi:hypothetical protein